MYVRISICMYVCVYMYECIYACYHVCITLGLEGQSYEGKVGMYVCMYLKG